MIQNFHNKICIESKNFKYEFFNTMLESVYDKLSNLESYCDKIAFGSGIKNVEDNTFKLANFCSAFDLETSTIQNDLSGAELFVKKTVTIDTSALKLNYLTEAGITSNGDDPINPTIYNYYSFIDENSPNGIDISSGDPLTISVYIYLNLSNATAGLFTKGKNPFISFLLGEGIASKSLYAARGDNLTDNVLIERVNSYIGEKYKCSFSCTKDSFLNLKFEADLKTGLISEIVFFVDDVVFARLNTRYLDQNKEVNETCTPKANYVIDLKTGVVDVSSVFNLSSGQKETNIFVVRYATGFASKIALPFNNLFNIYSQRFLSKDGDKLFFVAGDYVYLYKNEDYKINQIFAANLQIQDIYKIVSFDDFMFVFSRFAPYVFAYKIQNNSPISISIDLSSFEDYANLDIYHDIDIVQGKNGKFMIGFIAPVNTTTGYTLYLDYDESTNSFIYDSYISTPNYTFSYILPIHKNNFSDAEIWYLQAGATSTRCRRSIHRPDKSFSTGYTIVAYYYTNSTTAIYVKSRAVIVEKNTAPKCWVYYYPQLYRFELSHFADSEKCYISNNLLHMITKSADGKYAAFNLVGYDTPAAFDVDIPDEIDQSKILHIEFLIDSVLFFMDDDTEPIIGYNLNVNGTCIENVSNKQIDYSVYLTRKFPLGESGEGVIANLAIDVNV